MRHMLESVMDGLIAAVGVLLLFPVVAAAIQLCGPTQFADSVTLSAEPQDGPSLILSSNWVQSVPNIYDLTGPGTIIQKFTPQRVFVGSGMIGNTSNSFGGNPICRITPTLVIENEALLIFTGTAVMLCLDGPSGPFQVTLELILAPCQQPAFPGVQDQLMQWPGQDVPLDQRIAAGDAPNEYVPR